MTTISVIMPAFEAATTIGVALTSVLGQSRRADQLIVVDDGSTDATGEIAAAAGATVIRRSNGGAAAAMNTGLAAARGELVAFLDADDVWHADCLLIQARRLLDRPEASGVVARFSEFPCESLPAAVAARFVPRIDLPAWFAGGMLLRRVAFERAGLLDESFRVGAWVEWVDRARHVGCTFETSDDVLLYRRLRPGTLSQAASRNADLLGVVRTALARRRAGS